MRVHPLPNTHCFLRSILSLIHKNMYPIIYASQERPQAPSTQGLSKVVSELSFPFTLSSVMPRGPFDKLRPNGAGQGCL